MSTQGDSWLGTVWGLFLPEPDANPVSAQLEALNMLLFGMLGMNAGGLAGSLTGVSYETGVLVGAVVPLAVFTARFMCKARGW